MTVYIVMVIVFLAWMVSWWFCERERQRRLRGREPIDWSLVASRDFSEQNDRAAADIVIETIAETYGILTSQVYPDDNINVDYSYPKFWCLFMFDDPDGLIIDTLSERIEQEYSRWEPATRVVRVRDIITDVSRHLKACKDLGKNGQSGKSQKLSE